MSKQIERTVGGDRLGSGKKQKVYLNNFERSNHDLSYVWRSTMAPGTLVPVGVMPMLPGDTFDIDLNALAKTLPTNGPLFGSYKFQLDVFTAPVRLYQANLAQNRLRIGMKMNQVWLPRIEQKLKKADANGYWMKDISQSSLLAYLGVRGFGRMTQDGTAYRNALPLLMYWDVYKQYYANKQENKGAFIDAGKQVDRVIKAVYMVKVTDGVEEKINITSNPNAYGTNAAKGYHVEIEGDYLEKDAIVFKVYESAGTEYFYSTIVAGFANSITEENKNQRNSKIIIKDINTAYRKSGSLGEASVATASKTTTEVGIAIQTFPLENIDQMRDSLYKNMTTTRALYTGEGSVSPYGNIMGTTVRGDRKNRTCPNSSFNQMGLALKTYQNDIFNTWMDKEIIDGENGIGKLTSIDVSSGLLNLDTLNLSQKIYNMFNKIAISGGTYTDWVEVVYGEKLFIGTYAPVYHGGLSKEIEFEEITSTAEVGENPLGTLAGRGTFGGKHKGGKVVVKAAEPQYLMIIASITPRIDYSQGNEWHSTLETMDDFHKPDLDGIGYQDVLTDQMDWRDTTVSSNGTRTYKSVGKVPAWMWYMTNVNKTYGAFAEEENQMFMTLNRRYEWDNETNAIKDLTTYIDPAKYNYVFADASLDAQNFWIQIGVSIEARRKISARQIPNL